MRTNKCAFVHINQDHDRRIKTLELSVGAELVDLVENLAIRPLRAEFLLNSAVPRAKRRAGDDYTQHPPPNPSFSALNTRSFRPRESNSSIAPEIIRDMAISLGARHTKYANIRRRAIPLSPRQFSSPQPHFGLFSPNNSIERIASLFSISENSRVH